MKQQSPYGAVARELVGDNNPSVRPGNDPAIFGTVTMEPLGPVEARSFQTFRLTYTVGKLGLDDTGGIRIAWRMVSDSGKPQTTDPAGENFVTASSNGEGQLAIKYDKSGGQRPWNEIVTVVQHGGYLKEGEKITVLLGDTSKGSPARV